MIREGIAALLLSATGDYSRVEETDGILIESRPVTGSNVVELRLTTTTTRSVASMCDAAFGDGKFDPEEPDLKSRKILSESENERVTYEQVSPPVVANRDYAVRAKRLRTSDELCVMTFEGANELAPPRPDGWVRINKLKGEWRFERVGGKTRITYVIFSDPAGSIPAFMVEGSRRKIAVRWVKMLISRAKD